MLITFKHIYNRLFMMKPHHRHAHTSTCWNTLDTHTPQHIQSFINSSPSWCIMKEMLIPQSPPRAQQWGVNFNFYFNVDIKRRENVCSRAASEYVCMCTGRVCMCVSVCVCVCVCMCVIRSVCVLVFTPQGEADLHLNRLPSSDCYSDCAAACL